MPKLYLIDGTFELFRAYFAMPSIKGPTGLEVGATRGYMASLLKFLKDHKITHCGVAFDHTVESFRNKLFSDYKTGDGIEPDLLHQFRLVERGTAALGLTVWPMKKFEADDGIASAVAKFVKSTRIKQIIICSPDKDLCQCVSGNRVIMYDRIRLTYLNETGVRRKFGVGPGSIPDYLALTGDPADGIPGIPRWGAKSAASVLKKYRYLENIPSDHGRWRVKVRGAATLSANLQAMQSQADLYKILATLRTDAPIPESLDELRWPGAVQTKLKRFCSEIGDERFYHRAKAIK